MAMKGGGVSSVWIIQIGAHLFINVNVCTNGNTSYFPLFASIDVLQGGAG